MNQACAGYFRRPAWFFGCAEYNPHLKQSLIFPLQLLVKDNAYELASTLERRQTVGCAWSAARRSAGEDKDQTST
jgi:hypothetical protein